MEVKEVNMSELPEDTVDGVKVYGTTSYETQVAILSHYLHNFDGRHDIVLQCRQRVANAFFPLSGMHIRKRLISRTLVRCHLATSQKN